MRESPALYIVESLIDIGIEILAVEPNITSYDKFKIFEYQEAIDKVDIVVKLVNHDEFLSLENNENIISFV